MHYTAFLIYLFVLASVSLFVFFRSWLWTRKHWRAGVVKRSTWFGSPLVVVLALVYLTLDFMLLPKQSTVGLWRTREVYGSRMYNGGGRHYAWVDIGRRENGELCVLPEASVVAVYTGFPPYISASAIGPRDEGFWALTHTKRKYAVTFDALLTPHEEIAARGMLADKILLSGYEFFPGHAEGVRAGLPDDAVILWGGVMRTAAALCVAVIGSASLVVMPWWLWRSRGALAEHPRCFVCSYPREGLVADRCPECGSGFAG